MDKIPDFEASSSWGVGVDGVGGVWKFLYSDVGGVFSEGVGSVTRDNGERLTRTYRYLHTWVRKSFGTGSYILYELFFKNIIQR